jgi:hypothetical protein
MFGRSEDFVIVTVLVKFQSETGYLHCLKVFNYASLSNFQRKTPAFLWRNLVDAKSGKVSKQNLTSEEEKTTSLRCSFTQEYIISVYEHDRIKH